MEKIRKGSLNRIYHRKEPYHQGSMHLAHWLQIAVVVCACMLLPHGSSKVTKDAHFWSLKLKVMVGSRAYIAEPHAGAPEPGMENVSSLKEISIKDSAG